MLYVKCDRCGKKESIYLCDGTYGADTINHYDDYNIECDLCNNCRDRLIDKIIDISKKFIEKENSDE